MLISARKEISIIIVSHDNQIVDTFAENIIRIGGG